MSKIKKVIKLTRQEKAKKWWSDTIQKLESEKAETLDLTEEDIKRSFSPFVQDYLLSILFYDDVTTMPLIQCIKTKQQKDSKRIKLLLKYNAEGSEINSVEVHPSMSIEEVRGSESEFQTLSSSGTVPIWDLITKIGSEINASEHTQSTDSLRMVPDYIHSKYTGNKENFDFETFMEMEIERTKHPEENYWSIYKNFFNKDRLHAAIWRTQPPPTYEEMTLEGKAEAVTYEIASDFIRWIKTLCPEKDVNLNVDNIIKMFDIGGQSTLAQTLDMRMTELTSIPPSLAKFKKQPHMSRTEVLRKELNRDIEASKLKPKIFAFGSRLPATEQIRPEFNDFTAQWNRGTDSYEHLLTMEAIFKGIENLKSTRGYINYLKTKPGLVPPTYLVNQGLMVKNPLDGSDLSEETI